MQQWEYPTSPHKDKDNEIETKQCKWKKMHIVGSTKGQKRNRVKHTRQE